MRVRVLVAAAAAFSITHWTLGYWSVDDAGITYAYSIGLADHGSLSPLPESMPVEGYSNPLLFLFVALLRLLGLFDPITTHTKLELIAFSIMALLVYELLRARFEKSAVLGTGIFVVLELSTPSTWLWYRSGLENVFVSLSLVALVYSTDRVLRTRRINPLTVGVLCFLVALVRPEAPIYVIVFYGATFALARPPMLRLVTAGAITAGLYIAFLWWRHETYGVWLPNTYFAKLPGGPSLLSNFTDYVVSTVFPYGFSLIFALTTIALGLMKPVRNLAITIGVFVAAALVMPVVGGDDLMGEHRFATPFLAVSHLAVASLIVAVSAMRGPHDILARRLLRTLLLLPVVAVSGVRIVGESHLTPSVVTTAKVVELHGVRRMQHQRRLGVVDPVVVAPDAGGVLLYGSLQHIDNGYLTDFQMAHMRRSLPIVMQYLSVERTADLVDTNPNWPFDRSRVGTQYLWHRDEHMFARRDRVELESPPAGEPFYDRNGVRLYLAPDNVPVAAPGGLMRIECVVAWTDAAEAGVLTLLASVADDHDSISLAPYTGLDEVPGSEGIQRRTLLVRVPLEPGGYDVALAVRRDGKELWTGTALHVEAASPDRWQYAITALLDDASPVRVMRRFAWLREQSVPRLAQAVLRETQRRLKLADVKFSRRAAEHVRTVTWDARLASLTSEVPEAIRAAEQRVVDAVVEASPCLAVSNDARRALCIGREIDELRRHGYFGVLRRAGVFRTNMIAAKLENLDADEQYVALVGLSLAMPERVDLQKALLIARDRYAARGEWPSLGPRDRGP